MSKQIKVFANIEELNNFAAEKFIEIGNEAIKKRAAFTVALAGGSTPKALYRLLAAEPFSKRIDWSRIYFFLGDERNVPADDAESNFRMISESLFEPLRIPQTNIFPWRAGEKPPEETAKEYEIAMSWIFVEDEQEKTRPVFDLILLGMGADGHTASLFPYTEALSVSDRFAVANPVEKLCATRLTLTYPVINYAANVIFLVAGAEKAETLKAVLEGDFAPEKYPSQNVLPRNGNLFWLVDGGAASLLNLPESRPQT
ncbi:MAG TPA: 6-phosphogluconolactonase [Pyrinomonadaceae bacterium]|jgi:6-phosphogluconolactonase